MDRDFEITGSDRQSHNETWEDAFDVQRRVPDHYNQVTIHLRERQAPSRRFDLIFRAFNEGVAFRYFLPRTGGPREVRAGSGEHRLLFRQGLLRICAEYGQIQHAQRR